MPLAFAIYGRFTFKLATFKKKKFHEAGRIKTCLTFWAGLRRFFTITQFRMRRDCFHLLVGGDFRKPHIMMIPFVFRLS